MMMPMANNGQFEAGNTIPEAEIREALKRSYRALSPYADRQAWEFDNNLFHISFLAKRVPKDAKILDLGCGIGIMVLALKYIGFDVTGVDRYIFEPSNSYSVSDLEGLKKVWQKERLNIMPSVPDSSGEKYDVVASIAVIEHQSNLRLFMEDVKSSAKKGGYIYIATPNVANLLNRFRFLFGRAPLCNIKEFYESPLFTGHWREYTWNELAAIGKMAGLEVLEAGNKQTLKPYMTRNFRKWHRLIARGLGGLIPGCGDTIYLWAKK